jgi:hypothetical protein
MIFPTILPASNQNRGWLLKLLIGQAPSNALWGKEAPKEGGSPTEAAPTTKQKGCRRSKEPRR